MEDYQDTSADAFAAFVGASANLNPVQDLIDEIEYYLQLVEHSDDPRTLRNAVHGAMRCLRMAKGHSNAEH